MKTEHTTSAATAIYAAAVVTALGILPLPYGYYGFLRVASSLAFLYCFFIATNTQSWATALLTAAGLVVFNPFVPVHLSKLSWACIDGAAAAYLAILAKHVHTRFAHYNSPERTVAAIGKTLGFSVLLALFGSVGFTVLSAIAIIPLKWLGVEISGRSFNAFAYGLASAIMAGVLGAYAYHSGTRKAAPREA